MVALPLEVEAVEGVQRLVEAFKWLQGKNAQLEEDKRRLEGEVAELKKEAARLKEEMTKLGSHNQTPSSTPSTLPVSSEGNRPTDEVYNVFSRVFDHVETDYDGWVQETTFALALKQLYPHYKSSSWWKSKLHRTVDTYPDLIEQKSFKWSPQVSYFRLKKYQSNIPLQSSQPKLETKIADNSPPPQQPIGIADPPGITIRDRLVQSGQYAELVGALSVQEKTGTRKSIAEADVSGYWMIPGRAPKTIHGQTDGRGQFTTAMLVDTDAPEKCTLVITAIKKAGYTSPSTSTQKQWGGIAPPMDKPHKNGSSPQDFRQESELKRRYDYSVAATISEAARHQALQHAVEDHDGLGLAYVVRWLTNYNRFSENNPRQSDAVERREDDVRWLKTTYYNKLKVKHFRFPTL